jgi:hypothetical protein
MAKAPRSGRAASRVPPHGGTSRRGRGEDVAEQLTAEEASSLDFLAEELAKEAVAAVRAGNREYSSEKSVTPAPGARRARRRGAG